MTLTAPFHLPRLLWWLPLWAVGCAPLAGAPPPAGAAFRAAFSDQGVAWVSSGRACVARAPAFRVTCPPLPPAVDAAWNGLDAWAGVPGVGVIVTLDGAARTVNVGRVAALSTGRVYREDGSALTYAGEPARGVAGRPSAAVTVGGAEFALVEGEVRRVADGAVLSRGAAFLAVTAGGAAGSAQPQLVTPEGTYRLTGERLERLDAAGGLVATAPHGPGRVGRVGALIVTVDPAGAVRAFSVDLRPAR